MIKSTNTCDLKSCMFCKLCLPDWSPVIEKNRKFISVKKGEVLFKEGELMTGIYFVYSGIIKVHKQWGQKELIVRFANNGDIVGHRGLGGDTIYPVSGTALENSNTCFIPLEFFITSLKVNFDFLYELLLFFAEELKLSEHKMRNLAHMTVKGRVANALLLLKDKFGLTEEGHINILLSRQDFASYTGTTYETLFRTVTDLTENGIIQVAGKKIRIINEVKLNTLANNVIDI